MLHGQEREHGGMAANDSGTIVVVEDDPNIADLLDLYLRQAGYRVIQATTGEAGLAAVERERPRMVILDVGLPGSLDGLDVCRSIRAKSDLPVLMLTARDTEIDRILGLELGADDYVTKPFSPREIVARVKAILRRAETPAKATLPELLREATCRWTWRVGRPASMGRSSPWPPESSICWPSSVAIRVLC